MGVVVVKLAVKRKPGHLYYVDGKGNVCEAKMARGGKRKKAAKVAPNKGTYLPHIREVEIMKGFSLSL